MFTYFYPWGVLNVSGNLRETFRTFFCYVTDLPQMKLQRYYISEKYKFTTVNMCFISINPGKFPWGNFLRRKTPRKIFLTILSNFRNFFSDRRTFRKISGKMSWNFNSKSTIYRLYTRIHTLLSRSCAKCVRKLPGNFSGNFLLH